MRNPAELERPRTRGDCSDGPRPCPWIRCRYHLANKELPVSRRLKLRVLQPGEDTCALDVADRGPHTLVEIGALMGVTRERVRQIEVRALLKLRSAIDDLTGDRHDANKGRGAVAGWPI